MKGLVPVREFLLNSKHIQPALHVLGNNKEGDKPNISTLLQTVIISGTNLRPQVNCIQPVLRREPDQRKTRTGVHIGGPSRETENHSLGTSLTELQEEV